MFGICSYFASASVFSNDRLQQLLVALEERSEGCSPRGVGAIGRGLALQSGLHELLSGGIGDRCWVPPMAVLVDLARGAIAGGAGGGGAGSGGAGAGGAVFWIGRRCWPYPHALGIRDNPPGGASGKSGGGGLLGGSVFVDAGGIRERVWAAELAARSGAAAVVIADGTGLRPSLIPTRWRVLCGRTSQPRAWASRLRSVADWC
ncbi:MAG: hypothetical protein Q9O74_03065 [Planctomycetota bacterium]|nr:hypothetical protein [Planctomycetota bacterium]